MEPALRRRMFACPEWREFLKLYWHARQNAGRPHAMDLHGHAVAVTARSYAGATYQTMTYTIDGQRMTPAMFADTFNGVLNFHALLRGKV